MYCRYTSFAFDGQDRSAVVDFWDRHGAPLAARQPGFRGALVMESEERDATLRTLTLWRGQRDFQSFSSSPDHAPVTAGIRDSGMSVIDRDGLTVLHDVRPRAGEVRCIRCRVHDGATAGLREFWQTTAKRAVERAPGCIKAEAFVDPQRLEFVLMVWWRTHEDAERFRLSGEHREAFVEGLERFVDRIDRLHTVSLDEEDPT